MSEQSKNHEDTPISEADKKRAEIESIIQSTRVSQDVDEEAINTIIEYIEEKIYPSTLNKNGFQTIEKLYRKFELSDIIEAINTSASKYLKYNGTDELDTNSVETFIKKIGGILNLMNRPLIDQKIAYVKGICRNRFNYWNDRNGTAILKNYVESLRCCNFSEDRIIQDFDEEVIPETKTARNWSQWRNLIEGWTEQLYARSKEQQSMYQDQLEYTEDEAFEENDQYIEEKRKGGANSYQAYKPLRGMVESICQSELEKAAYSSANQLCNTVASIIEEEHLELLSVFQPYQTHKSAGTDWRKPTFYGWVNAHYKAAKV